MVLDNSFLIFPFTFQNDLTWTVKQQWNLIINEDYSFRRWSPAMELLHPALRGRDATFISSNAFN